MATRLSDSTPRRFRPHTRHGQRHHQQTGLPVVVDDALAVDGKDEPFETVRRRIRNWLAARLAGDETCIAFVSHGSPIKAALQLLSDEKLDLSTLFLVGQPIPPTAGIWRATRTEQGWLCELIFQPQLKVEKSKVQSSFFTFHFLLSTCSNT